jgi:GMP synthase-like glutamine amidotransferase
MRAVCLQHVPFEGPGVFAKLLQARGYDVACRIVPVEGLPADAGDFLLIMGGPMSANDPEPWIREEIRFIRHAIDAGKPVLGVCLGSQLMARALGAKVYPGPSLELGMTPVKISDQGRHDTVFQCMPENFDVFQWHGEVFDLPEGAVPLASSEMCLQAFRYGKSAYGLLFHLELDQLGIEALCRECPGDLERKHTKAEVVVDRAVPHLPTLHAWADHLLARLLPAPH